MNRKHYVRPLVDLVLAEIQNHILAASGGSITNLGEDNTKEKQITENGTIGDNEGGFELHSKSHNAWSSWDE